MHRAYRHRPKSGYAYPSDTALAGIAQAIVSSLGSLGAGGDTSLIGAAVLQMLGYGRFPIDSYGDRLIDWTPRVYTGVPASIWTAGEGRTKSATAEQAALDAAASGYLDGTLDGTALIQAAITAAVSGTYVEIPDGNWKILGALSFGSSDDNVTLRGESQTGCVLNMYSAINVGSAHGATHSPTGGKTITGFGTSGSNSVLTIDDTTDFTAGCLVFVQFANDPDIPVVSVGGYDLTSNSAPTCQVSRIVSKTSTTLTIFPGIYNQAGVDHLDAKVWGALWNNDGMAIENLTLDADDATAANPGSPPQTAIDFQMCYAGWVKDVTIRGFANYILKVQNSLQCEVRRTWIERGGTGGTNGSGIYTNNVSSCLFEDNIVQEVFPCFELNAGSAGNAVLYNFVHNDGGEQCINTNHGPHNRYTLCEGNFTSNIMSDGYFGGEAYLTLFRNLIHCNGIDGADTPSFGYSFKRMNRYSTVVGNVLGGPEVAININDIDYGKPNIGNSAHYNGTAQPSVGDHWIDRNADGTTPNVGVVTSRTRNDTELMLDTLFLQDQAQAGATNTITLNAGASAVTNYYKDHDITIYAGTGSGQTRSINAYNGTTKVATVSVNWTTPPDNTSLFQIIQTYHATAQAGSTNTITLHPAAHLLTDVFKYDNIVITGGTGSGQERMITAYNSSTKVAIVNANWTTPPDNTSTFKIYNVPVAVIDVSVGEFQTDTTPNLAQALYIWSDDNTVLHGKFAALDRTGDDLDVDATIYGLGLFGWKVPDVGTTVRLWPGPGAADGVTGHGFQELDLDVEATMYRKDNYDTFNEDIDDPSGDTQPPSLAYAGTPDWWPGSLTYPPVESSAPVFDYEALPAGYRYMNGGADPP